jgi:hypothetical protein
MAAETVLTIVAVVDIVESPFLVVVLGSEGVVDIRDTCEDVVHANGKETCENKIDNHCSGLSCCGLSVVTIAADDKTIPKW